MKFSQFDILFDLTINETFFKGKANKTLHSSHNYIFICILVLDHYIYKKQSIKEINHLCNCFLR